VHVALWICFYLLPYFFFPDFKELPEKMSNRILINHSSSAIYLIAYYYLNTLLFIPSFLFKNKWWLYIVITSLFFVGFMFAPKAVADKIAGPFEREKRVEQPLTKNAPSFNSTHPQPANNVDSNRTRENRRGPDFRKNPFLRLYFGPYAIFLLVFTIGTCISVMQRWRVIESTRENIEKEKLNTELSFLRSQVNPHFFFNTLNNIYSLAVVSSPLTAPAVLQLSAIMRYILTETQTDKVPLQNEIDFIKNFIDLQLVRLTDKVQVNLKFDGAINSKEIAPLLFIPFVENAFKYGVSTKEKTTINISLNATDKGISFYISNTIIKTENTITDTTGIGINNVKRRLELIYPDNHILKVTEENNLFTVQLDISI
jgi:hypothetical protein